MYCQYMTQLADYYIGPTCSIWQAEFACSPNDRGSCVYCKYVTQLADYYIGPTFSIWQFEIACNPNGRVFVCTVNM